MVGPRHPLPNEDRAHNDDTWRATVSELAALRQLQAVEKAVVVGLWPS
jgi:hypothetical protein